MSGATFALYDSPALAASQRATEGRVVDLDRPVADAGVTLFRRSFWLPAPASLIGAQSASLAADARLEVEFAPRRFSVSTEDTHWFPEVEHLTGERVRVTFAWPAAVVRVAHPAGGQAHAIELLRADGDAVASEPTTTGVTGSDLPEPWIGSPLVVRLREPVLELDEREVLLAQPQTRSRERARAAAPAPLQPMPAAPVQVQVLLRLPSSRVPALTLAGNPTSPRLKLFAEQGAGSVLLWQSMLAGAQGTVELPAQPIATEWAGALEQLCRLMADPATMPVRLRLDIESDAPCRVRLTQLHLALEAEFELLEAPRQLAFGGDRVEQAALELALPAGVSARGLRLAGRVVAEAAADAAAGAAPADLRRGALLGTDQAALQPFDLAAPTRSTGLALYWQPLSDTLQLRLRLLADAGTGPSAQVLSACEASLATPEAGWLALRWPAIDLQARRLWAELTVVDGLGLWPFGAGPAGWTETHAAPKLRQALPQALRLQMLGPPDEEAGARPISVRLGDEVVAAALPVDALSLEIPTPLLPQLATHPLQFISGIRSRVTIESARLRAMA